MEIRNNSGDIIIEMDDFIVLAIISIICGTIGGCWGCTPC